MVLLIYSVLLFLLAFPLAEASRISPSLTVSFTLLDLFVVPASIIWLAREVLKSKLPQTLQEKTFGAVILVFLISLLVNAGNLNQQQLLTAGLYIVRFFSYGSLFFIYRDHAEKLKNKLWWIFGGGGILLVVGGFIQYFFYPSLKNLIYFGWDEHFYRMFGTFFDPNFFGLFLALFSIYILWYILKIQKKQKAVRFVLYPLLVAVFIAILLTYSRTALLALVIGILVLLWKKGTMKKIFLVLSSFAVIVIVFFAVSNKKTDMNSLFRQTSADARIGSARNALAIFSDNPLFGIGFNAYRYAQYRHHFMNGSPIQQDHGASGADSSLLLVLATSGMLGFLAFCAFLWSHIQVLLMKKERIGLATIIALLVGSFFVNGLFYPLLLVWLWPLLGIIESSEQ